MSVAYVIRWYLLGSYVCFITTRSTTVDSFITVILYNLSLPNYCYYSDYWSPVCVCLTDSLHCTVQYLKYVPVTSIIGWQIREARLVLVTSGLRSPCISFHSFHPITVTLLLWKANLHQVKVENIKERKPWPVSMLDNGYGGGTWRVLYRFKSMRTIIRANAHTDMDARYS